MIRQIIEEPPTVAIDKISYSSEVHEDIVSNSPTVRIDPPLEVVERSALKEVDQQAVAAIEEVPLSRYPSSGAICSTSVPLSLESQNFQDQRNWRVSSPLPTATSISSNLQGNNPTQLDRPSTPTSISSNSLLSSTSSVQIIEDTFIQDHSGYVFENSSHDASKLSQRIIIADTYAVESSLIETLGSPLSAHLTLSQQIHSVYTVDSTQLSQELRYAPQKTVVPDTYRDDQLTLEIDMSDNEVIQNSDTEQESPIITRINRSSPDSLSVPIRPMNPEHTLVPQTQQFSLEPSESLRIVYDTYEDCPPACSSQEDPKIVDPPQVNAIVEPNPYDVPSSDDDADSFPHYFQKQKQQQKHLASVPENVVINLVNDTISPLPLPSGLEGTLISGTIEKPFTLVDTCDENFLLSQAEELNEKNQKSKNTVPESLDPGSFSHQLGKPPPSPLPDSLHADERKIPAEPELEEDNEYNVTYETQNEEGLREIGGFLYGAGIDSAVRRFTPQKTSPQTSNIDLKSPIKFPLNEPTPPSSKKKTKQIEFDSENYETQDSIPGRFSWVNNATTPFKHSPNRESPQSSRFSSPQRRDNDVKCDPSETSPNDEIASWGESLFDRIHDLKKMMNEKTNGLISPPTSEKYRKRTTETLISPPKFPKLEPQSVKTSPYITLKRFTSASSDVCIEETKDSEGDYEKREEWIEKIKPIKKSSPLLKRTDEISQRSDVPSPSFDSQLSLQKTTPEKSNASSFIVPLLTKNETISSDEPIPDTEQSSSPVIPLKNSPPSLHPIIVKMSSLTPQTLQLLRQCTEKGFMTLQCKDGFDRYPIDDDGTKILITLVESQKTKQGVPLCKRTMTYLKSLCLGSHWIVDANNWLNDCLAEGRAIKPDRYEIGGSIHDTHIKGPSRSRSCLRDSLGRSTLLRGYVFYLITPSQGQSSQKSSSPSEEDLRWMIYFCGGAVLNQRWCDRCLNTEECQRARRENRLIVLDMVDSPNSKKRKADEELISLSPAVEICGNCGNEYFRESCFLRQSSLPGTTHSPLIWLIDVICAHKILRSND